MTGQSKEVRCRLRKRTAQLGSDAAPSQRWAAVSPGEAI